MGNLLPRIPISVTGGMEGSCNDTEIQARNPIIIEDNTALILMARGTYALIDLADLPLVAPYRWCPDGNGYAQTRSRHDGALCGWRLHRYLMGNAANGLQVDHINGLRWDCRRSNLRLCTKIENMLNRAPNIKNSTGYKGIQRHKSGYYYVQIKHLGQQYRVGKFETPAEAARGYDFLAGKFFGEFARLNFPDDTYEPHLGLSVVINTNISRGLNQHICLAAKFKHLAEKHFSP